MKKIVIKSVIPIDQNSPNINSRQYSKNIYQK